MASIVTTDPRVGRSRGKGIVYAFLAPAVVIYSVFFVYPSLDALGRGPTGQHPRHAELL